MFSSKFRGNSASVRAGAAFASAPLRKTAEVRKVGQLAKPSRKWERLSFIEDYASNVGGLTVHLDGKRVVASYDIAQE